MANDGLESRVSLGFIALLLFGNSGQLTQLRNFREKFQFSARPSESELKLSLVQVGKVAGINLKTLGRNFLAAFPERFSQHGQLIDEP